MRVIRRRNWLALAMCLSIAVLIAGCSAPPPASDGAAGETDQSRPLATPTSPASPAPTAAAGVPFAAPSATGTPAPTEQAAEATGEPEEAGLPGTATPLAAFGPVTVEVRQLPNAPSSPRAALVVDPLGRGSTFVTGEVIFRRGRPDDAGRAALLAEFLDRYNGQIVDDGSLPDPASLERRDAVRPLPDFEYVLIRVDTSTANLAAAPANMQALGLSGAYAFSSPEALALSAILAEARLGGFPVTPNLTADLGVRAPIDGTDEGSDGQGGRVDAFDLTYMQMTNVTRAWQLVDILNTSYDPVRFAVVDSGFAPGLASYDNPDFPAPDEIVQWDITDGDGDASGSGDLAPWHGTQVAGIGGAYLDNGFGAAGTGGQIVRLQFIRVAEDDGRISWYDVAKAVHLAVGLGADVINLSMAGVCDLWCQTMGAFNGISAVGDSLSRAYDSGIIVVSAAGNGGPDLNGDNLSAVPVFPCFNAYVVCVGALDGAFDDGVYTLATNRATYSNYGSAVDIWAPGKVRCTVLPDSDDAPPCTGTSAAAPYVAGVLAMMRAVDPDLSPGAAMDILRDTAWAGGTDAIVDAQGILDAYGAVLAAAGGEIPADEDEPNNTRQQAVQPVGSASGWVVLGRTIHGADDVDYYVLECPAGGCTAVLTLGNVAFGVVTLEVLDSTGKPIPVGQPSTAADEQAFSLDVPQGRYFIRIRGAGDVGIYDLSLSASSS